MFIVFNWGLKRYRYGFPSIYLALILSCIWGCNFDRDIAVTLPPYQKLLATEAYLQPYQSIKILITETDAYFAPLTTPLFRGAVVTLSGPNYLDTLKYQEGIESDGRVYNYVSSRVFVPFTNTNYILNASDNKGRLLSGSAHYLKPPVLDTIIKTFSNADSIGFAEIRIVDNPAVDNFYRVIINQDSVTGPLLISTLATDVFTINGKTPIVTERKVRKNAVYAVRIYQLEREYYQYLLSVDEAKRSTGNPFTQPSVVKSTVTGGFGVFAVLSYITVILK